MRRGLTRKHALQFFAFLVSPTTGLAQRLLDDPPASTPAAGAAAAAGTPGAPPAVAAGPAVLGRSFSALPPSASHLRLRQGLMELLKALFSAPGNPFVADKTVSGAGGRPSR